MDQSLVIPTNAILTPKKLDPPAPPKPTLPESVMVLSATDALPDIAKRLKTISMDKDTLAAESERYSAIKSVRGSARIAEAYEALQEGRVLIDLNTTLADALKTTYDEHGRAFNTEPLAIGRPQDKTTWVRVYDNRTILDYWNKGWISGRPAGKPFYSVVRPGSARGNHYTTSRTSVPTIPAEIREAHRDVIKERNTLLLWEAEWDAWKVTAPRPPFDPALLQQVSGSLYAVVAVWDLTFVETAALMPGPKF